PQEDAASGLAHADRMREAQPCAQRRRLDRLDARAHAGAGQVVHVVELPLAGLVDRRQGPPPRSHLDLADTRRPRILDHDRQELPRRRAPLRPRPGNGDAGSVITGYLVQAIAVVTDPDQYQAPRALA